MKDRRATLYGHKVFVTAGASGLILDCVIEMGNPADATMALPMLERQNVLYGRPPKQAAMDGGFASKQNLKHAKELGIKDVCFQKKRGLKVSEMRLDLFPQACVRPRPLYLARSGVVRNLRAGVGVDRQSAHAGPSPLGLIPAPPQLTGTSG